jgi:hypothetical protein
MRRKSEMPSDEEVLDTKIWTLAKHLDDKLIKPHVFFTFEGRRLRLDEVVLSMGTSPYQVEVRLGTQGTAVAEESGEGDVRVGGPSGQPRAHSSSVGPTTSHSGGPEEC